MKNISKSIVSTLIFYEKFEKTSKMEGEPVKIIKARNPVVCIVCFGNCSNKLPSVKCGYCPATKRACVECAKEYLLKNPGSPHCMECKKEWTPLFFAETFPKEFREGVYRESRKTFALEREIGALPDTLPLVDAKKKENNIKAEIETLRQKRRELKKKRADLLAEVRARKEILRQGVSVGGEKVYVCKCPVEECKGFIEQGTWKCGLCEEKICGKCHVSLVEERHVCQKDAVESVAAIMKDTRPCPKCSTRIFKTVGCDQMFCTVQGCMTAFSWNTGEIATGTIHNPHYYEMMRKLGRQQRAIGDVPCGGLVQAHQFNVYLREAAEIEKLEDRGKFQQDVYSLHRRVAEVTEYIRVRNTELANQPGCEDIRLDFLMEKIKSKEEFKNKIYEREIALGRKREEIQILQTFEAAAIERFADLSVRAHEIYNRKKPEEKLTEMEEELSGLTVKELKEMCIERNLARSGTKPDLIARIKKYEDQKSPVLARKVTRRKSLWRTKSATKPKKPVKSQIRIPITQRRKLLNALFKEISEELLEIIKLTNQALEETFEVLGYGKPQKIHPEQIFQVERKAEPVQARVRDWRRTEDDESE